jgi:hypothetical protein
MKPLSLLLLLASFCASAFPARAAVNFRTQLWPIFAKNCVDCHRAPYKDPAGKVIEPKGRLRLDGAGHSVVRERPGRDGRDRRSSRGAPKIAIR